MSNYEPADRILEEAKKQADSVIKETSQKILAIRTNNRRSVNQKMAVAKIGIIKSLETENLATYSKTKIRYDINLQNELANKQEDLRAAIINNLAADARYIKVINQKLIAVLKATDDFKVFVNLDRAVIDRSIKTNLDRKLRHGFKVDFGTRIYELNTESIIDDYLKNNPFQV